MKYITGLVAAKKADPESTGLLAELIRGSQGDGALLTDKDLVDIGVLLLFAGHDTTMAMMGLSAEQTHVRPDEWFAHVHPDDVEALKRAIDAHLAGQTDRLLHEHRVRGLDGSHRRVLCRAVAARSSLVTSGWRWSTSDWVAAMSLSMRSSAFTPKPLRPETSM